MAGNSKEASQHAKEAGILSAPGVRAVHRLRGSPTRRIRAHHLRGRHYRTDASSIARHRASDCLRRSVDEVCTPSRDYQTRYAVRESRAARRNLPASPLGRSPTIDAPDVGAEPHISEVCGSAPVAGLRWKSARIRADLDAEFF